MSNEIATITAPGLVLQKFGSIFFLCLNLLQEQELPVAPVWQLPKVYGKQNSLLKPNTSCIHLAGCPHYSETKIPAKPTTTCEKFLEDWTPFVKCLIYDSKMFLKPVGSIIARERILKREVYAS